MEKKITGSKHSARWLKREKKTVTTIEAVCCVQR